MLLEIDHLTVRYEKAVLINDLSLCVDTGEFVSLVGPNGAGKSTTLRTISGLVAWEREIKRRSTAGDIFLEGTVTFNGEVGNGSPLNALQIGDNTGNNFTATTINTDKVKRHKSIALCQEKS